MNISMELRNSTEQHRLDEPRSNLTMGLGHLKDVHLDFSMDCHYLSAAVKTAVFLRRDQCYDMDDMSVRSYYRV